MLQIKFAWIRVPFRIAVTSATPGAAKYFYMYAALCGKSFGRWAAKSKSLPIMIATGEGASRAKNLIKRLVV